MQNHTLPKSFTFKQIAKLAHFHLFCKSCNLCPVNKAFREIAWLRVSQASGSRFYFHFDVKAKVAAVHFSTNNPEQLCWSGIKQRNTVGADSQQW